MGVTHAVEGAQLSEKDVEDCKGGYISLTQAPANAYVCMGIDVGTKLHYTINQYTMTKRMTNDINLLSDCRVLVAGTVDHFEELDDLVIRYNVAHAIIDNQPETRKALEFANRFRGKVHLCIYGNGASGKIIREHAEENVEYSRQNHLA